LKKRGEMVARPVKPSEKEGKRRMGAEKIRGKEYAGRRGNITMKGEKRQRKH